MRSLPSLVDLVRLAFAGSFALSLHFPLFVSTGSALSHFSHRPSPIVQQLRHPLVEPRLQLVRHRQHLGLRVRVVALGVLEDEGNLLLKVNRRLVVSAVQGFANEREVHGGVDAPVIVWILDLADGLPKRFRERVRHHLIQQMFAVDLPLLRIVALAVLALVGPVAAAQSGSVVFIVRFPARVRPLEVFDQPVVDGADVVFVLSRRFDDFSGRLQNDPCVAHDVTSGLVEAG